MVLFQIRLVSPARCILCNPGPNVFITPAVAPLIPHDALWLCRPQITEVTRLIPESGWKMDRPEDPKLRYGVELCADPPGPYCTPPLCVLEVCRGLRNQVDKYPWRSATSLCVAPASTI